MRWDRLRGPYGEDGFSLVELLVAIALFGLVLVALTGALISSSRSIGDQRLRTAATRVAIDHLETLRAVPFDELDARAGLTTTTTPDGRAFSVATAVTAIDPASGAPAAAERVKQITAVVSWESGGAGREVLYTTAVAAEEPAATESQVIGTISLFPSPATTDPTGRPLQDLEANPPGRLLDGLPEPVAVEGADKELLVGDKGPQVRVERAPVVEVGPHPDDHDDPPARNGGGVEEIG